MNKGNPTDSNMKRSILYMYITYTYSCRRMFLATYSAVIKEIAPTQTRSQTQTRPAKVYDILLNYVTYHTFRDRPRMCACLCVCVYVCVASIIDFLCRQGSSQADMTQGRVNGMECVQGHGDNIATHHHQPRSNRRLLSCA